MLGVWFDSINSYNLSLGKVPRISKKPTIYASKQFNRLAFFCDFASGKEEKTAIFEITWYEGYPGGKKLRVDQLKWDQRSSVFLNTKKFPEKPELCMGTTVCTRFALQLIMHNCNYIGEILMDLFRNTEIPPMSSSSQTNTTLKIK